MSAIEVSVLIFCGETGDSSLAEVKPVIEMCTQLTLELDKIAGGQAWC